MAARRASRRNHLHGRIGERRDEAAVTVFGADGRGAPAQGAPAARNAPPSLERPAAAPAPALCITPQTLPSPAHRAAAFQDWPSVGAVPLCPLRSAVQ